MPWAQGVQSPTIKSLCPCPKQGRNTCTSHAAGVTLQAEGAILFTARKVVVMVSSTCLRL